MSVWTDARTAELKKLWAEGVTASLIADRIGGVTRNGVIGKVHRLGLAGRVTPRIKPKNIQLRVAAPQRTTPINPTPLPPQHVDDVARVSFAQLDEHHCRWPVGEPTAGFCGLERVQGQVYCPGHVARSTREPYAVSDDEFRRMSRMGSAQHARMMGTNVKVFIHPIDTRTLEAVE